MLTAQCNLRCGYCFQNAKKDRRMRWPTLRSAIDLAFRSTQPELRFMFYGGEPLLEFPLLRRAVSYIESNKGPARSVQYSLLTNGTLLTPDIAEFLRRHWFEVQLSFDGVPEAQALRGAGTYGMLDTLLDDLRARHLGFFRWHLSVSLTLLPKTIPHLADSIDYFLDKGVRQIEINPAIGFDAQWHQDDYAALEHEIRRIYDRSVGEFQRTHRIPVSFLKNGTTAVRARPRSITMCGVMRGEAPAVDVDGQVSGCGSFSESFQTFRTRFQRTRVEDMRIGALDAPDLEERYAAFPAAVERAGIFSHKERKYSSYRRCGECEYLDACGICPMSIGCTPGSEDPDRIPDFLCAFSMLTLGYADRFAALQAT